MKTTRTSLGQEIKVSSNKKRRTFTIKTTSGKYRTYPMTKQEFESCLYNTGNDWSYFLQSNDYYEIN